MMAGINRLGALLQDLVEVTAGQDIEITGISIDSRRVEPGHLFVAMPGVTADGRDYISAALASGAVALLIEDGDDFRRPETDIPVFYLDDVRGRLGQILNRFFDYPSSKVKVIGITGTNGKTTCSQLISRVLDKPGHRCAVIGTLGTGYPGELDQGIHTTPDVVSLHALLAGFVETGAKTVCMEVSSHALEQERVSGVAFDIAVFTNLTRDHLDYHGDMESYAAAKAKLFETEGLEYAVINIDDETGRNLVGRFSQLNIIGYGIEAGDVHAENIQATVDGVSMILVLGTSHHPVSSHLYGEFNVSNLLAVAGVLQALGKTGDEIAVALTGLSAVPGRMEHFGVAHGPAVVVDYAHTPDALEQALKALRPHTQGALWCVFGCGGNRDTGKRPLMGEVADRLADHVVLTDDNPRDETAGDIIRDIEQGIKKAHLVIQPRERAVRETIGQAAPADLVLVAGKGHEDYQEIAGQRMHYSDRDLVRELLGEVA